MKQHARSTRHLQLAQSFPAERRDEVAAAFQRGRADGQTAHWVDGANVGFICGLLVGLGAGCAGAIFWIGFAVRVLV